MQKWQWVKIYSKISLRLRRGPVLPVQSMDRGMCLLRLLDLMLVWAQALEIWHLFVVYDGSIARVPQPFSYFLSDSETLRVSVWTRLQSHPGKGLQAEAFRGDFQRCP